MVEATLENIIRSARDFSFDRFVTPTFYVGSKEGYVCTITSAALIIKNLTGTILTEILFSEHKTLDEIVHQLLQDKENYSLSYSASFVGSEPSDSLLPMVDRSIYPHSAMYRQYFFSEEAVERTCRQYFSMVMGIPASKWGTIEAGVDYNMAETIEAEFKEPQPYHMALWCAYWLLENRRLYELAGEALSQSTFSQTGDNELIGIASDGSSIEVNIGDVFSITSDPKDKYNDQNPVMPGTDNVLGDADSFWYKCQLWIRDNIERLFGDYSLRKDQVVPGQIDLVKDQNFYAWYDQYPYTISPLSREILSSMERASF